MESRSNLGPLVLLALLFLSGLAVLHGMQGTSPPWNAVETKSTGQNAGSGFVMLP